MAARRKAPPEGIRYFEEPQFMLVRMGRQVATYYGAVGRLDVNKAVVELRKASVRVTSHYAELNAGRVVIDLEHASLRADRGLTLKESHVTLTAERATALPSLARLVFGGKVRIEADTREAADALLATGAI